MSSVFFVLIFIFCFTFIRTRQCYQTYNQSNNHPVIDFVDYVEVTENVRYLCLITKDLPPTTFIRLYFSPPGCVDNAYYITGNEREGQFQYWVMNFRRNIHCLGKRNNVTGIQKFSIRVYENNDNVKNIDKIVSMLGVLSALYMLGFGNLYFKKAFTYQKQDEVIEIISAIDTE